MKEELHELALFAGAGGGILGGHLLGWRTVCAVEIEDYPRRVLLARQRDGILPQFPIWDDIKTFNGYEWRGRVDVVSGGFPCQDISCAGQMVGIAGDQSGLWTEMARVISEVQPSFVFVENSPMLVNRGLGVVLGDLASMGYDARWGVLWYRDAGGEINRDRIWILAGTGKELCNQLHWRPVAKTRIMGKYRKTGSPIDRYMEELEKQGEQCEVTGESNLPSYLLRVDNGMAPELDQIKAIGNGQVPAVARLAWEVLSQ